MIGLTSVTYPARPFIPLWPRNSNSASSHSLAVITGGGATSPRAQKVGTAMRMLVEQSLEAHRDIHVIHLGDVYYSGWKYEYEKRFCLIGRSDPGKRTRSDRGA